MNARTWTCPYCDRPTTISSSEVSRQTLDFNDGNRYGGTRVGIETITCPNPGCREYTLSVTTRHLGDGGAWGPISQHWRLRPQSNAKVFPSYIPEPIRDDYVEACLIRDLSPKASATLSRRCLQGIIRDFWGISKSRLIDEINDLKGKIDQSTWDAIDAVRSIGNIGAHMERDINVVIDVEPHEAELLISLIEILFKDWYIARHERQQHLANIVAVAAAKKPASP